MALVAAVIVDTDKQWKPVERFIYDLIQEFAPPEIHDGFVLHAKDLFHGWTKNIFDKKKHPFPQGPEVLQVGKRDWWTGNTFVEDVRNRVKLPVQIATDNHRPYAFHIRQHFGYEGYGYGTETKVFGEPKLPDGTLARLGRNEGVRRMQTAERKAVVGSPDLESLTTSHIERAFLTVRQELKRFQRKGLGYSKDLETHKRAVALHFGVYNFVRQHHTLGTTPAVAAGLEEKPWSLEQVVDMTAAYWLRKRQGI